MGNTTKNHKMPDYQQGKVYRILQDAVKTVYIGSTTRPLSARMSEHRRTLKQSPNMRLYKLMEEVGVDHFTIELIIDCPCDRREVLLRAEGEQIRLNNMVISGCNERIAGQTDAEYRQTPENKVKDAARQQTPEYKAKAAARQQNPEYKAKKALYRQDPENKAKQAARYQTPEYKAKAVAAARRRRQLLKNAAVIAPVEAAVIE